MRLEKRLAVKDRFATLDLYRDHLTRLLGFQAAAEQQWGGLLLQVLDDYPARLKTPLLTRDIEALGGRLPSSYAEVPQAVRPGTALGGFYVLEGATLGGQHLLPIVERKLGLSSGHGASYLASYGAEVQPMWRKFVAIVETQCVSPQSRDDAGAAARETFLALETWLCGDR